MTKEHTYVTLNIDHASLGCGERRYLVLGVGRLWVRLFYCPTLTAVKVPRAVYARAHPTTPSRGLARMIRATRAQHDRNGMRYSKEAVRLAMTLARRRA